MIGAGGELRRAREARGMTLMQTTVAAREYGLPIGLSTLSRFEREESPLPLGEFLCLARALGLDAQRVLQRRAYHPAIGEAVRAELARLGDEPHLGAASNDVVAHVLGAARDAAAGGDPSYASWLLAVLRGPRASLAPAPPAPPAPPAGPGTPLPEPPAWMSDPRLNLLAGRIALACGDGPLAMDHLRRATWTLKQPQSRRPSASPAAPAAAAPAAAAPAAAPAWAQLLAVRAEILWAEAAVMAGGPASALSTLRRILAGRPTGTDGWLACDVAADASACAADLAEARRYLRRALTRAERSPDLKLLTWLRAHRIEHRFGQEDAATHAAHTARRVLAQEVPAEVGPLHLASILGARPPGNLDLVALRLLSLFD